MRTNKLLKLLLLMLVAPLFLIAWAMIWVGEKKDIRENIRSTETDDTQLTIYPVIDGEAPKAQATQKTG
jgi:hypothetical protein